MKWIHVLSLISFMNAQKSPLSALENLVSGIWSIDAKWSSGQVFNQQIEHRWDMEKKIIRTRTFKRDSSGVMQTATGIRMMDAGAKQIRFWEFSRDGNVTSGIIRTAARSIIYEYDYGNSRLRDTWTMINANTYNYKVAAITDGKETTVYLTGVWRRAVD